MLFNAFRWYNHSIFKVELFFQSGINSCICGNNWVQSVFLHFFYLFRKSTIGDLVHDAERFMEECLVLMLIVCQIAIGIYGIVHALRHIGYYLLLMTRRLIVWITTSVLLIILLILMLLMLMMMLMLRLMLIILMSVLRRICALNKIVRNSWWHISCIAIACWRSIMRNVIVCRLIILMNYRSSMRRVTYMLSGLIQSIVFIITSVKIWIRIRIGAYWRILMRRVIVLRLILRIMTWKTAFRDWAIVTVLSMVTAAICRGWRN